MYVALAWLPNAPPKVAVHLIPVATAGSFGANALADVPVSLMADGMLPLRTPSRVHPIALLLYASTWHCFYQCACMVGQRRFDLFFASLLSVLNLVAVSGVIVSKKGHLRWVRFGSWLA